MTVPAEVEGRRELMMETILRQADAGVAWEDHCAALMSDAGIAAEDVEKRLQKRAFLLTLIPAMAILCSATVIACLDWSDNILFQVGSVLLTQITFYLAVRLIRSRRMHITINHGVFATLALLAVCAFFELMLQSVPAEVRWQMFLIIGVVGLPVYLAIIPRTYDALRRLPRQAHRSALCDNS